MNNYDFSILFRMRELPTVAETNRMNDLLNQFEKSPQQNGLSEIAASLAQVSSEISKDSRTLNHLVNLISTAKQQNDADRVMQIFTKLSKLMSQVKSEDGIKSQKILSSFNEEVEKKKKEIFNELAVPQEKNKKLVTEFEGALKSLFDPKEPFSADSAREFNRILEKLETLPQINETRLNLIICLSKKLQKVLKDKGHLRNLAVSANQNQFHMLVIPKILSRLANLLAANEQLDIPPVISERLKAVQSSLSYFVALMKNNSFDVGGLPKELKSVVIQRMDLISKINMPLVSKEMSELGSNIPDIITEINTGKRALTVEEASDLLSSKPQLLKINDTIISAEEAEVIRIHIKYLTIVVKNETDIVNLRKFKDLIELNLISEIESSSTFLDTLLIKMSFRFLKNLKKFTIHGASSFDFISLHEGRESLKEIKLTSCSHVKNLDQIDGWLDNLQVLQLNNCDGGPNNSLTDIIRDTHWELFETLQELELSNCKVTDTKQFAPIPFLLSMENLQKLDLSNNPIQDYSSLLSLKKLKELTLSDDQIIDDKTLASLKKKNVKIVVKEGVGS